MFKCTECNAEYEQRPDYCECGNDNFEEVIEEDYYDEEEYDEPAPRRSEPEMTPEQLAELAEEKKEKIKSLIALGVTLVLCILVFVIPPHKPPKMQHVKEKVAKENIKLPSVDTYWDDTVPSAFKKNDPLKNLPVLNERFASISNVLREYLKDIGKEFNKRWNTSLIKHRTGSCTVLFVIDKEGGFKAKSIAKSSDNQDFDDSISLLLTNMTGFDIPPDDYKGEKIYITFSFSEKGDSKVSYPSMTPRR